MPLDVHHVIPQTRLKQYATDHRLSELERLQLLTDARNSLLTCEDCHHGDTSRSDPIKRSALHEDAWAFARELGFMDYVRERYPEER